MANIPEWFNLLWQYFRDYNVYQAVQTGFIKGWKLLKFFRGMGPIPTTRKICPLPPSRLTIVPLSWTIQHDIMNRLCVRCCMSFGLALRAPAFQSEKDNAPTTLSAIHTDEKKRLRYKTTRVPFMMKYRFRISSLCCCGCESVHPPVNSSIMLNRFHW